MKELFYGFTYLLTALACLFTGCTPEKTTSRQIYEQLKICRTEGDTAQAKRLVGQMLDLRPSLGENDKGVHELNNGLLQLMYSYIYAKAPEKGADYFAQLLYDSAPPLSVPQPCRRQLLFLAAYLYMQHGVIKPAIACLDEGFPLPPPPTADERYAHYLLAAAVYSQADGMIDRSIEMYEKSLDELRHSSDLSGLPWALANLGELYSNNGQFEKAVGMYYEALPLFGKENNHEGSSTVCSLLAQLFLQWGMNEEAARYAREELDYALRSEYTYNVGQAMLDLYEVAMAEGKKDEAARRLQEADSCFVISNSPVERLSTQGFAACLLLDDSLRTAEGIRELERVCADSMIIESPVSAILHLQLGHAYLDHRRSAEGISLIDSALPQMANNRKEALTLDVYRSLIDYYRKAGKYTEAMDTWDRAEMLRQELFKTEKLHQVTASRIRFETTRKEIENEVLHRKVEMKQRTLALSWTIGGLLIALLGAVGLYYRQRQRHHRDISEARLSQISSLLDAQQSLKHINEQLAEELLQASEQALRQEPTEVKIPEVKMSDIRSQVYNQAISPDKVTDIRCSFNALYPDYLPTLHSNCPDLTRTDELIAMLLRLGLNNDEIAQALNITKGSVNKARSRMRKRLGLVETGVVLEDFLKGI